MSLSDVMKNLSSIPREDWLFIPAAVDRITLDIVCAFVCLDDYLDDEIERFCAQSHLKEFFFKDQLEDITFNLAAQKKDVTEQELEAAIHYYWRNDAFICLEG